MKDTNLIFFNSIADIEHEWNQLFEVSSLSYFSSLAWHRVVLELLQSTFLTKRLYQIVYFKSNQTTEKSINKIIGFFFINKFSNKDTLYFTHLLGPSDYFDFIYDENIEIDFIKETLVQISKKYRIPKLTFSNIREDSKLFMALKGFLILQIESLKCVKINLPADYDSYLLGLSQNSKKNLRNSFNRLKTNELKINFSYQTNKNYDEIDFKNLKKIYNIRNSSKKKLVYWKSIIYQFLDSPFESPKDIFDLESIKSINFVLISLKLNDNLAAYFFGLKNELGIEFNKTAIIDNFKYYSPGIILLNNFIKDSITTNLKNIDLTVGDEKYKYDLGGKTHQIFNITLKV